MFNKDRDRLKASREVLAYYKDMLEQRGYSPINLADSEPTSVDHLLWMCVEAIRMIDQDKYVRIDKVSRWLGYIQGVLVCNGMLDVAEERERTRPIFTGVK